jgi:hypothetical protein
MQKEWQLLTNENDIFKHLTDFLGKRSKKPQFTHYTLL